MIKRYHINFAKTVNQLVPHYLGGRNIVLYLQAILRPLQQLSDSFSDWADETRIEASMTSQVFKLEWFLNRRFDKYFLDKEQRIFISNASKSGTPIYYENAELNGGEHMVFREEGEVSQDTAILNYEDELSTPDKYSFTVYSPQINTKLISQRDYKAQLAYWVNRYRIATKTFTILFY